MLHTSIYKDNKVDFQNFLSVNLSSANCSDLGIVVTRILAFRPTSTQVRKKFYKVVYKLTMFYTKLLHFFYFHVFDSYLSIFNLLLQFPLRFCLNLPINFLAFQLFFHRAVKDPLSQCRSNLYQSLDSDVYRRD